MAFFDSIDPTGTWDEREGDQFRC